MLKFLYPTCTVKAPLCMVGYPVGISQRCLGYGRYRAMQKVRRCVSKYHIYVQPITVASHRAGKITVKYLVTLCRVAKFESRVSSIKNRRIRCFLLIQLKLETRVFILETRYSTDITLNTLKCISILFLYTGSHLINDFYRYAYRR